MRMAWTMQRTSGGWLLAATGMVFLVDCGRTGLLVDYYLMEGDAPTDAPDRPDAGPASDPGPEVAVGNEYSCWRRDGIVKCWGGNASGQLGNGTTSFPQTVPVAVSDLGYAVGIAPAHSHACALLNDWTVSCWGNNNLGEIGDGTGCAPAPTCADQVRVLPVSVLSEVATLPRATFALHHTCAQMRDGTVWCWGSNQLSQLCDGADEPYWFAPKQIANLRDATALHLGGGYTCAMWGSDLVQCCGGNDVGQLGDGTTTDRGIPTPVAKLSGVAQLSAGWRYACARLLDGTVVCWGHNEAGQLGDGTKLDRHSPVAVPGLYGVAGITAGTAHTCVRMVDGTARCWGANQYGQLGDGTTTDHLEPTAVVGLEGVVELAVGGFHTCARLQSGDVMCWGRNWWGTVGDGTTTDRLMPTSVAW